jgi:hypothetical protein
MYDLRKGNGEIQLVRTMNSPERAGASYLEVTDSENIVNVNRYKDTTKYGKYLNRKALLLQLIPEKILENLQAIEDFIKPTIKGFCTDNLIEVISIVACRVRKKDENRNEEPTAQIQMTYFKSLVPQGDKYLNGLMDYNVIKRSGNCIVGQTSYQYSFTPEYKSKYISIVLNNPKLIKRIEIVHSQYKKNNTKSIRGHSIQAKYLNQLTLAPGYYEFIEANYSSDTEKYNYALASVTRIENGDIKYNRDNTSFRFHSNVTNMPKGLRQFIRIKGEPLGEPLRNPDVKSSQPCLSTVPLINPCKVSKMTKNPAFTLLLQSLKVPMNQDVMKYISLMKSGQFYEYLMNEFSKEGIVINRDETKKQVLRILYDRNRMPVNLINRRCKQIFKDRFPTVHKIFSKIRGSEKGDKFSNYKRFAILLQSIESYLILDVILKRIYKELPGTIAITIHDSIMTNNVEPVLKIMKDELTFFIGFEPKIEIE